MFISYAREDEADAKRIADALAGAGQEVWWDPHLRAGDHYPSEIERRLNSSDCVLVLWSKASIRSNWVRSEATVGMERGVLLTAMLEECKVPVPFREIHHLGAPGSRSEADWTDLVEQVEDRAGEIRRRRRRRRLLQGALASAAVVAASAAAILWPGARAGSGEWSSVQLEHPSTPESYTRVRSFDLVMRAEDPRDVESIRIDDAALAHEGNGLFVARAVPLPNVGRNEFTVQVAHYDAGPEELSLVVVRDESPPELETRSPGEDEELLAGDSQEVRLTFDEEVSRAYVGDTELLPEGKSATGALTLPHRAGPWRVPFQALDLAGNELRGELLYRVGQPSAPAPAEERGDFEIVGLVVDDAGAPLSRAEVSLTRPYDFGALLDPTAMAGGEGAELDAAIRTTTTASDGTYSFRERPREDFGLRIRHPGFAEYRIERVRPDSGGTMRMPRAILRPGVKVYGFVRAPGGEGIGGALVSIEYSLAAALQFEPVAQTRTTHTGFYILPAIGPGPLRHVVRANGWATSISDQTIGSEELSLDVELQEAAAFRGRVTDPVGSPIPSATVHAYQQARTSLRMERTTTDEEGRFHLEELGEGPAQLLVRVPGFRPKGVKINPPAEEFGVTLEPAARVEGRVLDGRSLAPVPAFHVSIQDPRTEACGPSVAVEDGSGRFRVDCPGEGAFVVVVDAPGYARSFSETVTVAEGQVRSGVDVLMSEGGRIAGRFLDEDGRGLRDLTVTLHTSTWAGSLLEEVFGSVTQPPNPPVRTDPEGRFTIRWVSPGTYSLAVEGAERAASIFPDVQVEDGRTSDLGDLVLADGATVEGHVVDSNGAPRLAAVVEAVRADTPAPAVRTSVDSRGYFRLRGLTPGAWKIYAKREASNGTGNPFAAVLDMKNSQVELDLQPGETRSQDLVLPDS